MKRMLVALSHPRTVLLLGTVFAVGIAVQVWRRGMMGANWAYLVAGILVFGCLSQGNRF